MKWGKTILQTKVNIPDERRTCTLKGVDAYCLRQRRVCVTCRRPASAETCREETVRRLCLVFSWLHRLNLKIMSGKGTASTISLCVIVIGEE